MCIYTRTYIDMYAFIRVYAHVFIYIFVYTIVGCRLKLSRMVAQHLVACWTRSWIVLGIRLDNGFECW